MPDDNKIGSISSQWGKIGGRKAAHTPDNQGTGTSEDQPTKPVEDKAANHSGSQDSEKQNNSGTSASVVQTSGTSNNERTEPQNDKEIDLPEYEWTDDSNDEDTDALNDLPPSSGVNKVTRNLDAKPTRGRAAQSSSTSNKQGTKVKVVQYIRKVKPERIRQTVYLYPEVLRWIKRRIAETDEEISDVANYTAQLCTWLEEKHPEIINRFEKQRRQYLIGNE